MNNKNIFSVLLVVVSVWLLWPILKWAISLVIGLVIGLALYFWFKSKQIQSRIEKDQNPYSNMNSSNHADPDIIDVEYTERSVENDSH